MPPGSEPASGSDSANAGDHSPLAHRGRKRCFCSSVPNSLIGSVPSSWTIRISAVDAHALAISSIAMLSISVPVPVPPYSVSNGSPSMSCSASSAPQVVRVLGLLVDLGGARRDPLLRDLPDRVPEVEMLLGDRVQLGQRGHASLMLLGGLGTTVRARGRRAAAVLAGSAAAPRSTRRSGSRRRPRPDRPGSYRQPPAFSARPVLCPACRPSAPRLNRRAASPAESGPHPRSWACGHPAADRARRLRNTARVWIATCSARPSSPAVASR